MTIIDFLFKKDHTGKRIPTFFTWSIVFIFVFLTCFLSQKKKIDQKESYKSEIIKRDDIYQVAVSSQQEKKKQTDVITPLLSLPKEKSGENIGNNQPWLDRKYGSSTKIPLGSLVECMLIHNIVTNNFSSPVIAQVVDDFYFNGILLLPKDSRIYGEARAGREKDRVLVAFKTIVLYDGTEINIKARGLNADGSGGIKATIINEQTKEKVLTKVMNFLSGIFIGFQEKTTNAITGLDQVSLNSRNAILEGGAKSFSEEAKRMQDEIKSAQGYGVIVAGERIIIYFDESVEIKRD